MSQMIKQEKRSFSRFLLVTFAFSKEKVRLYTQHEPSTRERSEPPYDPTQKTTHIVIASAARQSLTPLTSKSEEVSRKRLTVDRSSIKPFPIQ
jgi:hypothetical protein